MAPCNERKERIRMGKGYIVRLKTFLRSIICFLKIFSLPFSVAPKCRLRIIWWPPITQPPLSHREKKHPLPSLSASRIIKIFWNWITSLIDQSANRAQVLYRHVDNDFILPCLFPCSSATALIAISWPSQIAQSSFVINKYAKVYKLRSGFDVLFVGRSFTSLSWG